MKRIAPTSVRIAAAPVPQRRDHDCGPAALVAASMFLGVPVTLKQATRFCNTSRAKGTTPKGVERAAKALGLGAAVESDMSNRQLRGYIAGKFPVLLAIRAYRDGHWVVGVGYSTRYLYVNDPMLKHCRGRLAWSELDERWWDEDDGDRYDRLGVVLWHKQPPALSGAVSIPG